MVNALNGRGEMRHWQAGRALREAKRAKESRYRELVGAERCHLLVMAFENGGR